MVGGEHASYVDLVHRVGAALGKHTPSDATPAWALMTFAHLAEASSWLTRKEPDVTPESATLVCGTLRVDSTKAMRELDYVKTPLDRLLADTVAWLNVGFTRQRPFVEHTKRMWISSSNQTRGRCRLTGEDGHY